MLVDCHIWRHREWGAMAALGGWRPLWLMGACFCSSLSYYMLVEVSHCRIKMSAILILLPCRSLFEAWYSFLALAFLDNLGIQFETTTIHNITKKKVEVTFKVGK